MVIKKEIYLFRRLGNGRCAEFINQSVVLYLGSLDNAAQTCVLLNFVRNRSPGTSIAPSKLHLHELVTDVYGVTC